MSHLLLIAIALPVFVDSPNSKSSIEAISFGSGNCGKLQGGVPFPCRGPNFEAFSKATCATGRNYLHPLVQRSVVDAFKELEVKAPKRIWQFGDMGKVSGGRLRPHKTHQNGLSVDFFVPVMDRRGEPVPISGLNKGYRLAFDHRGRFRNLKID